MRFSAVLAKISVGVVMVETPSFRSKLDYIIHKIIWLKRSQNL
jgi:hypothetical protein